MDFSYGAKRGEFGVDTWMNESWKVNGNTNVWPPMSADETLGMVYLPTGFQPIITMVGGVMVTIFLPIVSSRWTARPASEFGTSRLCTTIFGITIYPLLQI